MFLQSIYHPRCHVSPVDLSSKIPLRLRKEVLLGGELQLKFLKSLTTEQPQYDGSDNINYSLELCSMENQVRLYTVYTICGGSAPISVFGMRILVSGGRRMKWDNSEMYLTSL